MNKLIKWFPLVLGSAWLVGCSSTITNLTPSRQPRNATGMYPIEVAWDTSQQSLRAETLRPFVVVEFESYPMRQAMKMKNRWETVIPVPPSRNSANYHFRFDYDYNTFGTPRKSSKLSAGYRLEITEPKP